MSLTQERINEIALKLYYENGGCKGSNDFASLCDIFLSIIREEQEAVSHDDPRADEIVSGLYRKFKEWSNRKFSADDVTWCEVKGEINKLISIKFTIPPAAPDCPRRQEDGGMSSTAVVCGNASSSDVLIKKIQEIGCSELVEALRPLLFYIKLDKQANTLWQDLIHNAEKALANHAKRMKGEE